MDRFVKIGEAAKALGGSISTLRRRQKNGKLKPTLTRSVDIAVTTCRRYSRRHFMRIRQANVKPLPMPACQATIKKTTLNAKNRC